MTVVRKVEAECPVWTGRRLAALGVAVALVLLVHIGTANVRRLTGTTILVTQARLVLDCAEHVRHRLSDAEASERAYVVTGDEAFRASLARSIELMRVEADELRQLTAGDSAQRARVAELGNVIRAAGAELEATTNLRRSDGPEMSNVAARVIREEATAAHVGRIADDVERAERERLKARIAEAESSEAPTRRTLMLGAVAAAVLTAGLGLVVARVMGRRLATLVSDQIARERAGRGLHGRPARR
jgi:two-component system sensor kinase FixL